MVIRAALDEAARCLKEKENLTPRLDAAVLLCHVLGKDRGYLITHDRETLIPAAEAKYRELVAERAQGRPVAYLTGEKEFMSLSFAVNEHVLIPRADTETLVEAVLEENKTEAPRIADLCCGSGCIGVSLAYYIPGAQVTMVDISENAIQTAEQNALRHGVASRCRFVCTDLLSGPVAGEYDIVVSNPPYIETTEIAALERDVTEYEPRLALDGGADGLVFYRRLAQIVPAMLRPGGLSALEVGHTQAEAVMELFAAGFHDRKTVCDLAGIRRVVMGHRNG